MMEMFGIPSEPTSSSGISTLPRLEVGVLAGPRTLADLSTRTLRVIRLRPVPANEFQTIDDFDVLK